MESGIENYSRYLDGRKPGSRPFCLIDYFPDDYMMIIDESHVSIPQVHAMYGGDRSRKENLVEYGFRLPSALDNRPLKFEEFERLQKRVLYVSATPADYELKKTEGFLVEQIIRPTGLLDPEIEVRPSKNQIDDLIEEIQLRTEKNERVLITTLTKRMAVSIKVSPFLIAELPIFIDMTSAPSLFPASSNELCVLVDGSKNKFICVLPLNTSIFLFLLWFNFMKASDSSRI